jgi:thymidylate synthase (FAD)
MVTVRESVPIFVARQRFKHTVGFVYNEVSRRYVDDQPEFYTPTFWRGRAENKKQGSSDEVISFDTTIYNNRITDCVHTYYALLDAGVAPEQARMVLPQSMYTSYYVTGSLAAWARAYNLRSDPHAQQEIQDLAKQWDEIMNPLFPVSWQELTKDNNE